MGHAGDLEQPGGQRLSVGVGVARLRGGGVGPVAHEVEAERLRLVANRLHTAVASGEQDRPKLTGERLKVDLTASGHVNQGDGQTARIRVGQ